MRSEKTFGFAIAVAFAVLLIPALVGHSAAQAEPSREQKSYIVVFEPEAKLTEEVSDLRAEDTPVPRVWRNALKGAKVLLTPDEAVDLARDPAVRSVERDGIARKTSSWGLDRVDQRFLPLSGSYTPPSSGAGARAYILDTGLRSDHEQFRGRVLPGWTAISDGRGTEDCDGHGTHVAGTVLGSVHGVARGASVVPVRVLGCTGSGSWSGVISALDWIVADHDPGERAVANMSLGGERLESVNAAVERVVQDGVPVAVSAGNEDSDACDKSPASAPGAHTVGSTASTDIKSSFSNWGSCVDIWAPGSQIVSAGISSTSATRTLSGTSMASPHVAGALLLRDDVLGWATPGVVDGLPSATANRLLYVGSEAVPPPPPPPAPMTNDNFRDSLELGDTMRGSNVGATREPGEPSHAGYSPRTSIWYHWTPTDPGRLTLSTAGSDFDTLLAVYRGESVSNLGSVVSNDDYGGQRTSQVSFSVTPGQTYRIAVDGFGGRSGQVVLSRTWEPLLASISEAPPTVSPNSSARFVFRGAECSLDGGPWEACTSPRSYSGLGDGEHHFRTRYGSSVAEHRWTVDASPPPVLSLSRSGNEVFWVGQEGATFFCSVGRADPAPCSSPFLLPERSPGTYLLRVWQQKANGLASEAAQLSWTVADNSLRIFSRPRKKTTSRKAVFRFGGLGTQCRLDGGAWQACQQIKSYKGLRLGRHRFQVRDQAGVAKSFNWRVIKKKR